MIARFFFSFLCFYSKLTLLTLLFKSCYLEYVKRVIVHPAFKNISFKEAERLLAEMDQGECIVRPSSKVTMTTSQCYVTISMHVHWGPHSFSRLRRYCVGLAGGRVPTL